MTEKIMKRVFLGLLILGLSVTDVSVAVAQKFGGSNINLRDYTEEDAKRDNDFAKNNQVGIGDRVSGATAAANERYNEAGGGLKGVWNAISGAATDAGHIIQGNADRIDAKNATSQDVADRIAEYDNAKKRAANGEKVYTSSDGSVEIVVDGSLNAVDGIMEGCVPIPLKLEQLRGCIFCPLFKILYEASKAMAVGSFNVLAGAFKILLMLGFALYIAYITLLQVSSFTKQDAPKYITNGLTMAFKVFFAWLLLTYGAEIYRLALEPLLSAGIEMGSEFMQHQTAGTSVNVSGCGAAVSGTTVPFYSDGLYSKIDCFLKRITQEIAVSQSIGASLMCVASHKASHWYGMWDLTMFTTGLIMWAVAWLICLAFAFYLIDTVVRLGIIGAVMPFLIAAWPFKITQAYTATGWKMFLNAFFTFVFLGLVISINVELSAQAATGGAGGGASGTENILNMVNNNDVEALLELMSIGMSGLIFMLLCCLFGFKFTGEAAKLAAEMSGASAPAIGSQLGAVSAGVTKGMAVRAWGGAGNALVAAGNIAPSAGAFTDKLPDHGSLSGDVKAVTDKVLGAPARLKSALYDMTPAGRRLAQQQATSQMSTGEQPVLPNDNQSQEALSFNDGQKTGQEITTEDTVDTRSISNVGSETETSETGANAESRVENARRAEPRAESGMADPTMENAKEQMNDSARENAAIEPINSQEDSGRTGANTLQSESVTEERVVDKSEEPEGKPEDVIGGSSGGESKRELEQDVRNSEIDASAHLDRIRELEKELEKYKEQLQNNPTDATAEDEIRRLNDELGRLQKSPGGNNSGE